MLSTPEWAKQVQVPWTYQQADRLVYCNLLEHLVLHIKICEHPHPEQNQLMIVGVGGIYNFIVPELNDIYSGIHYKEPWKQKVVELFLSLKSDYFKCILKLVQLNFPYPLLTSLNINFRLWDNKKNQPLYQSLKVLDVKK